MMGYAEDADLPVPDPLAKLTAPLVARASAKFNGASDPAVRSDLINLDFHLDRADRFIERGALGGTETPNAADLQIGSGVRLLLTIEDLVPRIEGRPCEARGAPPLVPRATRAASRGDAPAGWLERAAGASRAPDRTRRATRSRRRTPLPPRTIRAGEDDVRVSPWPSRAAT